MVSLSIPNLRRLSAPKHMEAPMSHVHRRPIAVLVATILLASMAFTSVVTAAVVPFVNGDVMAAVGSGSVKQFSPTGVLKNTLVGTNTTYTTGMAFDGAGNLYVSDFFGGSVDKYDTNGTFVGAFITGLTGNPESLSFDAAGNLYVGQADGSRDVLKYDSSGTFLGSFDVAVESRGSDWIDLAADQCTLFYTSEGFLIKRYNVCTSTQLTDFATLPSRPAFALRIRPNGDVIVAASSFAYRLDSTGTLVQTYTIPGASLLFGMNLDLDGTSFWTGDLSTGAVNRIDIATGTVLTTFNSAPFTSLAGLAIVGEIRAGNTNTVVSYTGPATVQYSDPLILSGHLQTSTATAIAGQNLGFVLGTDIKSAGPTDASGNASAASYNQLQQPGSATSVVVSFAGDTTTTPVLNPSTATAPFTITKEDCTVAYTGDTLVNAANMTNLSAQFGELDATPGDWTNKTITFTVTDAAFNVQTFTATTNASGVASTTAALGPNVYGVGVSFAGDDFYLPCAAATDTLVTVQSADAKITGGGWISQAVGRTNFGFNVIRDVTGLKGQLQVRTRSGKDRFHSTSVLTLNMTTANSGTWTGTGRWNGVVGHTFTVSVVDNGTSGKKGDTISIVIKSPTNAVVFTTNGPQPLKGGNIVVH